MADPQQPQVDTVQHPTLGTLKFPVDMPASERNQIIDGMLAKMPKPPEAATTQTPMTRLFGAHPLDDALSTVGTHLKNLVTGPYHAIMDDPRNPQEAAMVNSHGGVNTSPASVLSNPPHVNPLLSGLNRLGLAANRMLVQPTQEGLSTFNSQRKAGNTSLTAPEYDSKGNYTPTALSGLMDAIPLAGPLARSIENDAHQKGAVPALLGGAIDIGAPEAASGVFGKLQDAAPSMAEGGMGIRRGDRGFGKTPGRAILDETSGVRPATVGAQAQLVLDKLNPRIDSMAAQYPGTIDISPARQTVADAIDTARSRNNAVGRDALAPVADQLNTNLDNGLPLSANQPATGLLNLKRGLRDAFVKNWSPDAASVLTRDTARSASGVLDSQLDKALGPEFADTNQRISSLIPVTDAAEKLSRADELPQRFGDKLRAHTGALTSAIGGAIAGGHSGGLLGALGGGTVGFALPELLGGPTARLTLARGMDSSVPGAVATVASTGGILTPKKEKR